MYTNPRSAANAYAKVGRDTGALPATPAEMPAEPPHHVHRDATTAMPVGNVANAYAKVGLETGVVAATPHQLIVMLYEGAELALKMAIRHMNEGDVAKKSSAISKASTIISDGLRAALDLQQGGDLAQRLDALYDYMNQRLQLAHLKNQTEPVEEVLGLLQELHGAWKQIATPPAPLAA